MASYTDSNSLNSDRVSNTLAAIFATAHDAHDAIAELHKAGFKKTWLGKTRAADAKTGEALVDDPKGGLISRFLNGQVPLYKALVEQGLSEERAMEVESGIAVGCSVLTVYGEDNPQRVIQILEDFRGDVIGADGSFPTAVATASRSPRVGVSHDEKKMADEERHGDAKAHRPDDKPDAGSDRVAVVTDGSYVDPMFQGDEFIERPYSSANRP
jgi:hypothetical protein